MGEYSDLTRKHDSLLLVHHKWAGKLALISLLVWQSPPSPYIFIIGPCTVGEKMYIGMAFYE